MADLLHLANQCDPAMTQPDGCSVSSSFTTQRPSLIQEQILTKLRARAMSSRRPMSTSLVVVNTCRFIDAAVKSRWTPSARR